MIVVTGASGLLGRLIVEHLLKRMPAHHIGVSVRDPAKAAGLAACGVRVRQGDFDDSASLGNAFEGATAILIVSSNARASGGNPLAQHNNAIAAARSVGAQRIVYTSHMGVGTSSHFPPMWDHAATEAMLAESEVAWTALRHGFYIDSGLMLMGDAWNTGVVAAPEDGPVSWTAHADLAEADAAILAAIAAGDGARWDGPTPPLTGSQALDLADMAAIASDVLGRQIHRKVISENDLRAKMAERGAPARAADMVAGLYAAMRAREFSVVDPTLEALIGRPLKSFRDLIAAKADPDHST